MNKRYLFFYLLLVGINTTLVNSCSDDDSNHNLQECLDALSFPVLPDEQNSPILLDVYEEILPNGLSCMAHQYSWAPGNSESYLLDPSSDVIYPGGLLRGNSIISGSYAGISANRTPIIISHSANGQSVIIDEPSLSSVRAGINELSLVSSINPANMVSDIKQVHSEEHLRLSLKANYDGVFTDVSAKFNFQDASIKSRFLVEFYQTYYSIDVDGKSSALDWFEGNPNICSTLDLFPMYVASVKYGRVGMLMIESSLNATEVKAALEASFSGIVTSGGFDIQAEYSNIWSSSSFKLLLVGGSPTDGVQSVNSISGFNEWIQNGGVYSDDSPGSPISYTLRFLDGSLAKVVQSGEYTVRDCGISPQIEEVSFTPTDQTVCLRHINGNREFSGNGPVQKAKVKIFVLNEDELWAEINYNVRETIADWTEGNYSDNRFIWKASDHGYEGYKISEILSADEFFTPGYPNGGIIDTDHSVDVYPETINGDFLVKQFVMMGDTPGNDLDPGENENSPNCHEWGNAFLTIKFNSIDLKLELQ